jgi:flagellar secretion chaperone FliS
LLLLQAGKRFADKDHRNAMNRDAYLESKVLSADAVGLIGVLYEAALDSVRDAREHLTAADIAARSKAICKAVDIIDLLGASLDHKTGGDISRNLASLYVYIRQRLLDANLSQTEAPLAEVLGLLTTLAEAWHGIRLERETVDGATTTETAPAEARSVPNPWEVLPQQVPPLASQQRAWSF